MQKDIILPKEYEEYFSPRAENLSPFDKSVYECLSLKQPSSPPDIYPCTYGNKPHSKRKSEKLTKTLTKLIESGLVCKTTRKTGEGYNLYFSSQTLIKTLFDKGPLTKDEIASCLGLPKVQCKPQFLESFVNKGLIGSIGSKGKDFYYFLAFIPGHKEKAEFREIPYSEEIYSILADGKPKKIGEIVEILSEKFPGVNSKTLYNILQRIENERDWLVGLKLRGGQYRTYYRQDKASSETVESLKNMKDEQILMKILMILKEPKTQKQVEEESGLSSKMVSVSLKKLEKNHSIFSIAASYNRHSSSNPIVYFKKSGNHQTNELRSLKALFISETVKYGAKMFDCFFKYPIVDRKKIVEATDINYYSVSGLLNRFRKLGLVKNHPKLPLWYNPKLVSEREIKKILQLYATVMNGIEGFNISEKYGIFVAIPQQKLPPEQLSKIANSTYMPVENEVKLYIAKSEDKPDFFSEYRRYTILIKSLISWMLS